MYAKRERLAAQDGLSNNTTTALHRQSTSPVTQIYTGRTPSICKPGCQYVHPMRLAPRAYTHPPNQSCQTPVLGSEGSQKGQSAGSNSPTQSRADLYCPSMWSCSGQTPRLSLQIHDGSPMMSPGASQTNVTSRSSFGYSQENGSTLDTTSPVSRSSLDFVFRSKTRASPDPVARAATVRAARQAFEEREAAKTWRFKAQQIKFEEKQTKQRRKQVGRMGSIDGNVTQTSREDEVHEKPKSSPSQSEPRTGIWKSQPGNTWVLFLTWLRTRIFKIRRKIQKLA
ncbi:hypothetical protein BO70DRAFT_301370 [Aspergillus heteromorphus CBS 117.55]|uniref:Uncharacterized protein n=1 Tax=Aspergillus heteromorphus CBS 117.55 TaxID=1448321 RepID=A0A317V222_9EURO|nr:uncharacterized protein BO70DRAFT_301370 [Aspergillus heteromorphus CBS 117.55]PWY66857.1 hypothetical protein BO70DRAFT_301370 [Aspergillus heteromorphus CBS 117.55]